MFRQALESTQPQFGKGPEGFDAIDMATACSKLVGPMMHTKMLLITQIDQAVICTPATGVNHAVQINMAIMLEYAEYDGLAGSTPDTLASNPYWPEVRLIQFDFSRIGRLGFAVLRNVLPYLQKNRIDRPGTDAGQPGRIAGRQTQSNGLHQAAKSCITDLGIFIVSVFPLMHRCKRMLACNLLPKSLLSIHLLPCATWELYNRGRECSTLSNPSL